jgi:anti-anti-sigma factor
MSGFVSEALEDRRTNSLVFDLSEVDLMDSAGLQELMEAVLACEERPVAWVIIPSPPVDRLLELVGLGRLRSDQPGGWLRGGGYGDD